MVGNKLGDYLRARRELVRPEEHGLPDLGHRRVPGLRREELAMLAGISAEYYIRLERGRDRHPSSQVLDALARVLDLDDESRIYLASLAGVPAPVRAPVVAVPLAVRTLLQDARGPAFVLGPFMDVLASNPPSDRLHQGMPGNVVQHVFLDPAARSFYPDWAHVAAESVASLRGSSVEYLNDPRLASLIGELSLKSAEFRTLWARQDVQAKTAGSKRILSPEIGAVSIQWAALDIAAAPGTILVTYSAEPSSESQTRLGQLNNYAR